MVAVSDNRLERLRLRMKERGIAALSVRDTSNIYWISAFDDLFDEEQAHCLYVDDRRALLHTDSRYLTACLDRSQGTTVEVDGDRVSHASFLLQCWNELLAKGEGPIPAAEESDALLSLGIEDSMTLAEYRRLTKVFDDESRYLAETSDFVLTLRAVKDAEEIRRLKAAQAITDAAFSHIVTVMKPGMTEREVQLELDDYMYRHGASGLAFPSIVATGANGASPHAIPGETVLEAGQCVVMDFGARAQGYCSDMTRTVFLGQPEGQMLDAWHALRHANEACEAMVKPGITGIEVHQEAERLLAEGGFEGKMGHGLGHGVGIDIHEEPCLNLRNKLPLQEGNVVTVEPGIYLPGQFGMRLEDFGVVRADGFEVFTQSTHDLVVL